MMSMPLLDDGFSHGGTETRRMPLNYQIGLRADKPLGESCQSRVVLSLCLCASVRGLFPYFPTQNLAKTASRMDSLMSMPCVGRWILSRRHRDTENASQTTQ